MNWKFWQKAEQKVVGDPGEAEFIPVLPDERVKEEEDRFHELLDAWIHGKEPFKSRGVDMFNRRSLTAEIAHLHDVIYKLQLRVSHLEGNDPPGHTYRPSRVEKHVAAFLDHGADKAKEVALAVGRPACAIVHL